jgi:hypothetical protein
MRRSEPGSQTQRKSYAKVLSAEVPDRSACPAQFSSPARLPQHDSSQLRISSVSPRFALSPASSTETSEAVDASLPETSDFMDIEEISKPINTLLPEISPSSKDTSETMDTPLLETPLSIQKTSDPPLLERSLSSKGASKTTDASLAKSSSRNSNGDGEPPRLPPKSMQLELMQPPDFGGDLKICQGRGRDHRISNQLFEALTHEDLSNVLPREGILLKRILTEGSQKPRDNENSPTKPALDDLVDKLSEKLFSSENLAKILTRLMSFQGERGPLPAMVEVVVNRVLEELPKDVDSAKDLPSQSSKTMSKSDPWDVNISG